MYLLGCGAGVLVGFRTAFVVVFPLVRGFSGVLGGWCYVFGVVCNAWWVCSSKLCVVCQLMFPGDCVEDLLAFLVGCLVAAPGVALGAEDSEVCCVEDEVWSLVGWDDVVYA